MNKLMYIFSHIFIFHIAIQIFFITPTSASQLTDIEEQFNNYFILFGYDAVCVKSSEAPVNEQKFAKDFERFIKNKYLKVPKQFIKSLDTFLSRKMELSIKIGIQNAYTSSLIGCKHNIEETIAEFKSEGIDTTDLIKVFKKYH